MGNTKAGSKPLGHPVALRLHRDLLDRLAALRSFLLSKPRYAPRAALNLSDCVRIALELGVRDLERQARKEQPRSR